MKRIFTPEMKKVIFLDMNRTLIDPESSMHDAFQYVMEPYTNRWNPPDGWSLDATLKRYRDLLRADVTRSGKNFGSEQSRLIALQVALKDTSIALSEKAAQRLLKQLEEQMILFPKLSPGVHHTIETLARHYTLAIISNGSKERQLTLLQRLGLTSLIAPDHLFTFQRGAHRKPEPAIFNHALTTLNIGSSAGVMVGDSWRNDVMGAAGVSMDSVWLHQANKKQTSIRKVGNAKVVIVRKFSQLSELFGVIG